MTKKLLATRTTLHKEIWSTPLVQLSDKHNVPAFILRKLCKKLEIPFPESGYWSKLKFGKKVDIPILPIGYSGPESINLDLSDKEFLTFIGVSQEKILLEQLKSDPTLPFIVPKRLTNPHPLIIEARDSLNKMSPGGSYYKDMVSTSVEEVNIRVTQRNIARALRIMNSVVNLLYHRGHYIKIKYGITHAVVYGEEFEISLKENMKHVTVSERYWDRRELHPTNILSFRIERLYPNNIMWKDGKVKLEDQLPAILAKLEFLGEKGKLERIENEKRQAIRDEELRIENEKAEAVERERKTFEDLIKDANRWQQAEIVRGYLDKFEARAKDVGKLTKDYEKWINWGREKVEELDPIKSSSW